MRSNRARNESALRRRATRILAALLSTLAVPLGFSQCAQQVTTPSYSACFPSGWTVEQDKTLDRIIACNTKGPCATGWGSPVRGLAFLFIIPADRIPEHPHYRGAHDIPASEPHAGLPAPEITECALVEKAQQRDEGKCFVGRRLLSWAGAWDEVYGLELNKRLFRVWTRYEDDPRKIAEYRASIREILSSISLK